MSHTPGPWELHHQSPEFSGGDCDWSLQTDAAGAFLLFCHHPEAPADANGRLIVAAPDLLAALLLAREYVARVHGTVASAQGHENTLVKPDLDKIDAAIIKATGAKP